MLNVLCKVSVLFLGGCGRYPVSFDEWCKRTGRSAKGNLSEYNRSKMHCLFDPKYKYVSIKIINDSHLI